MNKSIVILALVLSGCATQAKYEAKVKSWEGHPSTELVQSWGVPTAVMALGDGSKVYEYYYGNGQRGIASTYNGQTTVTTYDQFCKTTFIMGPDDKVKSWKYEGNICRCTD